MQCPSFLYLTPELPFELFSTPYHSFPLIPFELPNVAILGMERETLKQKMQKVERTLLRLKCTSRGTLQERETQPPRRWLELASTMFCVELGLESLTIPQEDPQKGKKE